MKQEQKSERLVTQAQEKYRPSANSALLLTSCVIEGRLPNQSAPHLPHLQNGNNTVCLLELLKETNGSIYIKASHKLMYRKHYNLSLCSALLSAQSCLPLCNPWSIAHQAPLSMRSSRQDSKEIAVMTNA